MLEMHLQEHGRIEHVSPWYERELFSFPRLIWESAGLRDSIAFIRQVLFAHCGDDVCLGVK
jgi:hypothetical protein